MLWTILRSGAKALLKTCLLTFLIGVLVLVTGINPLGSSLSRFGKLEGGDVLNARGDIWEAASRHILQQPIGYGWKASSTFFESMQDLADVGLKTVHNSYLQFILELGVIGLIPLAYLVWSLLALAWRGNAHGIGAGLVGVVTAGIIVQLTESAMFGTGQGYPYIVWFAVAGALATYVPKPKHEHQMDLRSQLGEAVRRLGLTSFTRPRAGLKSRTTPVGG